MARLDRVVFQLGHQPRESVGDEIIEPVGFLQRNFDQVFLLSFTEATIHAFIHFQRADDGSKRGFKIVRNGRKNLPMQSFPFVFDIECRRCDRHSCAIWRSRHFHHECW